MDNRLKKFIGVFARVAIMAAAIASYAAIFAYLDLWGFNFGKIKSSADIFSLALIALLYGLIISGIAVMIGSKIARKIFIILNGIYFAFGLYGVYFAWNFYIFEVPTFIERIESTRMSLGFGVLVPIALFYYLEKIEHDRPVKK